MYEHSASGYNLQAHTTCTQVTHILVHLADSSLVLVRLVSSCAVALVPANDFFPAVFLLVVAPLQMMPGTAMEAAKRGCSPTGPRGCAPPTFLFLLLVAAASATDTVLPGAGISGNQTLVSKNGDFELGFFAPGAGIHHFLGVRFKRMPSTSPTFWVGDRVVISDLSAAALEVFAGSLCITEAGSTRWCSPVAWGRATAAVLIGDGNMVVRDQANASRVLWQSFDSPGDSLLPGARLGLAGDTGANIS